MNTILIDGSLLEGGGQILRNAISFAALCQLPIKIVKIRAGRPKPGLSNQHMFGLELAAKICNADLEGCAIHSTDVCFTPQSLEGGDYECDVKTAGSVALIMQIVVPILAFAKKKSFLSLRGGTDVCFAPPVDYMIDVTAFYYRKFGIDFHAVIVERGYFPLGGGLVDVTINPVADKLSPINMKDIGSVIKITGSAIVAGKVPIKVAKLMGSVGRDLLGVHFPDVPIDIKTFRVPDNSFHGSVSAFMFFVETSTGCRFGISGLGSSRQHSIVDLITDAINQQLIPCVDSQACCDMFMQDQLILPMALASGTSVIRTTPLTLHTQSAIYVAERILPSVKFNVENLPDGKAILLSCTGIGAEPH